MADPDTSTSSDNGAAAQTRGRAKSDGPDIKAEQRSFAEAGEALGRAARGTAEQAADIAQSGLKAGQEVARKAGGQAADLWRSSLDPLAHLQNEMGRWMEQAWRQTLGGRLGGGPMMGEALFAAFSGAPTADLYETDHAIELVVELPGLTAQDVQLAIKGDVLVVSGSRSEDSDRSDGAYRMRERRWGQFERSFALPHSANRNGIDARFDKGVLTVTIPKTAQAAVAIRAIPIKG